MIYDIYTIRLISVFIRTFSLIISFFTKKPITCRYYDLNMKQIDIFIRTDNLSQVTDILQKNGVGGITFYEIIGAGRMKREAVPEMVRSYMTGRTITPEYVKRTKVEVVVPDSAVKMIVDALNDISSGKEAHGMIFVKDVSDAYEIGTKVGGEAALSVK
jgi:nitrogen regulatory protein P-II 1